MEKIIELNDFQWGHTPLKNFISEKIIQAPSPHLGSVDVRVTFKNKTNKQFKYIEFTFQAYNSVNDVVGQKYTLNCIGPINPNVSTSYSSKGAAWLDSTITKVRIKEVKVTYMDNSTETVPYSDLIVQRDNSEFALKLFVASVISLIFTICFFTSVSTIPFAILCGMVTAVLFIWGYTINKKQ